MAYFRKMPNGTTRAEIEKHGKRITKVHGSKRLAEQWAAAEEMNILKESLGGFPNKTFRDALERYVDEVSSTKKGSRFEGLRIGALIRDFPSLVKKRISELTTPDLSEWKNQRLKVVSRGSVQRDIQLISNVFTFAVKEWKWLKESPLKGMAKPGDNPSRTRLVSFQEIKQICRRLGYVSNKPPETKMQEVGLTFLISLRTGMRSGEVLQLNKHTVNLTKRVASISHKTQHITGKPREVPLTKQAVRLIKQIPEGGFSVTDASRDALFRKATSCLLIEDLHFHDARATALTLLSRKPQIDVMTLAKISGHSDLRILQNVYYRETAADIAKRI